MSEETEAEASANTWLGPNTITIVATMAITDFFMLVSSPPAPWWGHVLLLVLAAGIDISQRRR